MSSKRKPIPAFKSEAEERDFWERHDSADYVDWDTAERVRFPHLKSSEVMAVDEKASRAPAGFLLRAGSPRSRGLPLPLGEGWGEGESCLCAHPVMCKRTDGCIGLRMVG